MLQFINDALLQIRLRIAALLGHSQELQDVWIFHDVLGTFHNHALFGYLGDSFLFTRKCQALIESSVELSLQLTQTPSLVCSLIFIEFAFLVICDAHEEQIVRPTQRELRRECLQIGRRRFKNPRRCFGFLRDRFPRRCFGNHLVAICNVKTTHILEIIYRESSAKAIRKIFREFL